ncbi:MAG: tetratricopeptide repeat protein, partial [Verrucomicrobiota bacterium]
RVTDAQKAYQQCLALESDNYLAHNNLGLILLNQNQLEEAISHFRKAVETSHGDTLPSENLALALSRKKSTEQ